MFRRDLMAKAVGTSSKEATADAQDRAALVSVAVATLRARGETLTARPQDQPDWGIRAAHFRDPDRNLIEINSSLPA